jgi:hypothetical protein
MMNVRNFEIHDVTASPQKFAVATAKTLKLELPNIHNLLLLYNPRVYFFAFPTAMSNVQEDCRLQCDLNDDDCDDIASQS